MTDNGDPSSLNGYGTWCCHDNEDTEGAGKIKNVTLSEEWRQREQSI